MHQADNTSHTAGSEMHTLIEALFPLHRSIAGPAQRETLAMLQAHIPLEIHGVASGTAVFDWQVPQEWHLRDAFIADERGQRLVDVRQSNLHIINHSHPLNAQMTWRELKTRLVTLPAQPQRIPYRTAYFQKKWGFCLSHQQFETLESCGEDTLYHVCIDADFVDGELNYGELFLPGESTEEVLISANICHPSLANDGLSGVAVATWLAKLLTKRERRLSYRFIFIPATIGAISWLSINRDRLGNIRHGLILQVIGDAGHFTYKKSRRGNALIDRAAVHVLKHADSIFDIREFEPFGYDERQFCSPGIDLPLGVLMRTPHGEYPEYHTDADNLQLVQPQALANSLDACLAIVDILENDAFYLNRNPMCEPRLGKWGLYFGYGSAAAKAELQKAVQWTLNFSDGRHSLLDIAERAAMPFGLIKQAAAALCKCELLKEIPADLRQSHSNASAAFKFRRGNKKTQQN